MITTGLRRFRDWLGYSQDGIATSAGMQQRTWSNWEKQAPDALVWLYKLAQRHGVSADYIIGLIDTPSGHFGISTPEQNDLFRSLMTKSTATQRALLDMSDILHRFEAETREDAITEFYMTALRFVEKQRGAKVAEELHAAINLLRQTGDDSALTAWLAAYLGSENSDNGEK